VSQHGDAAVVRVAGEIDAANARRFYIELVRLAALARSALMLIVDLTRVGFFAAAGIRSLLDAREKRAAGQMWRVVATGLTRRVLELVELPVYPSVENAGTV
jgi:anti-anti-sigma factor